MEVLLDYPATLAFEDVHTETSIEVYVKLKRLRSRRHSLLIQELPTPGRRFVDRYVSPDISVDPDDKDLSSCWLKVGEEENETFHLKFASAINCTNFMEIFKQARDEAASRVATSKKRVATDAPPGKLNMKVRATENGFDLTTEVKYTAK